MKIQLNIYVKLLMLEKYALLLLNVKNRMVKKDNENKGDGCTKYTYVTVCRSIILYPYLYSWLLGVGNYYCILNE